MSEPEQKLETIVEEPKKEEPEKNDKGKKIEKPPKEMTKVQTHRTESLPPKITNQTEDKELETNSKRKQVNKKLSTMSKNTKEKQKNKPLRKPTSTIPPGSLSKLLNINPMYLLGIIGVLIAEVSLWFQRKSYLRDENEQQSDDERDEGPKHPGSGQSSRESNFFWTNTK